MGSKEPFEARTDHRNLQCLRNFQCQNSRQARWAFFFSQYDFYITYIPGSQNILADALSRRYPGCGDSAVQNLFDNNKIIGVAQTFLDQVKSEYARLHETELKRLRPQLHIDHDYYYHDKALFLPTKTVQIEALHMCHDSPIAGHRGVKATQDLLLRSFWWPTLKADTEAYVLSCPTCAQAKTPRTRPVGLLRPLPVPPGPWLTISTDFMCALPSSMGNHVIMVTVDSFTKMAHFTALRKLPTAKELSQVFTQEIFRLHGLPQVIISDRGPQYISRFWNQFCKILGIQVALSSGFHPQTNGQTERLNQGLEQYLRSFCNATQSNWAPYLPLAEFSYNNSLHSASKVSPFYGSYGFHPRAFPTPLRDNSNLPAISSFVRQLRGIQRIIHSNLVSAKSRMKTIADRRRCAAPLYQVHDKVWLSSRFLPLRLTQNKFKPRFYGPFLILKKINPVSMRLRLPRTWKIHPVFHVSQLKPYRPDLFHRRLPCPPPLLVDNVPEYEVQEVCDSRFFHGRLQYLIHWKGYPLSECSWEDASSVHAPLLIRRFFRLFPHKPGASGRGHTVTPRRSPRPRAQVAAARHVNFAAADARAAVDAEADTQVAGVAAAPARAMKAPGSRSGGHGARRSPFFKFCLKGRRGRA
ncbi:hypothetical protein NDU88_006024 [Pleurodeles waltl]|uniref:Gypsy retrotransposon integrase-like protein 1 n=1 Tax=Pleurodeles waltl TaxID=8319 RepID=A0AAV7PHB6_PLEWA|nr:hypothetical protein NDU88_006024 [Pleurodeles waltl]